MLLKSSQPLLVEHDFDFSFSIFALSTSLPYSPARTHFLSPITFRLDHSCASISILSTQHQIIPASFLNSKRAFECNKNIKKSITLSFWNQLKVKAAILLYANACSIIDIAWQLQRACALSSCWWNRCDNISQFFNLINVFHYYDSELNGNAEKMAHKRWENRLAKA